MQINVKVFANLRDKVTPKLGIGEPIKLDINQNETIRDLLTKINLIEDDIQIIFVDGIHKSLDYQINENDTTVSLFSPAGGG